MESHKKIVGILFIVTGVLQAFVYFLGAVLVSTLFPLIIAEADDPDATWILQWVSSFGQLIMVVCLLFFALPSIIAGIGILNRKRWALVMALVLACFKLFAFPVGTAIGIYTIWVYTEEQKLIKNADS